MSATESTILHLPDQSTAVVPKKNFITAEDGLLSWLLTGDHKRIAEWRRTEAARRTEAREDKTGP